MSRAAPRLNNKGFTLVELLVVITIIAVLATIGLVVYSGVQKNARMAKRISDLKAIQTALELYYSVNKKYPSVATAGIFVCLSSLTGANSLTPKYMSLIPGDPSGSSYCYQYTSDGTGVSPAGNDYKVKTNGALPTTEMGSNEYKQQPNLIDPDRDGTPDDNCAVQTTGTITAWAIYSGSNTACNW